MAVPSINVVRGVLEKHFAGPALYGTPHARARVVLPLPQPRRVELQDRHAALGAGDRGPVREAVDAPRPRRHPRLDPRAALLPRAHHEDRDAVTGAARRLETVAPSAFVACRTVSVSREIR